MANETWERQRDLRREITRGEWAVWVRNTTLHNPDQKARIERKLANSLGFEEIPRGRINLGWFVEQVTSGFSSSSGPDGNNAEIHAATLLSEHRAHGQQLPSTTATLVHNLMFHRENLRRHKENGFTSYGNRQGRSVTLYEGKWTDLNETLLAWAMMISPFSNYDMPTDERLKTIRTNEAGRLHNPNGPAVTTSSGRSVYALNGVALDSQLWAYRNNAQLILKVNNVEQRRALIEDMGTELFVQESGLSPIHRDETGMLYRLESTNKNEWSREREHLCWVHVKCPSTDREYMLAVPPNTRTAREGVAWTFHKLPEEYSPSVQT